MHPLTPSELLGLADVGSDTCLDTRIDYGPPTELLIEGLDRVAEVLESL